MIVRVISRIKRSRDPMPADSTSSRTPDQMSAARRFTLVAREPDRNLFAKFSECFRDFNVHVRPVQAKSMTRERAFSITGCVLPLNDISAQWVRQARWFVSRRTLVYGIGDFAEAARFQDLGINALLEGTTDFSIRLAVSATQSVVSRGIGEYARVPIVTTVVIEANGMKLQAITRNVGKGGMAASLLRNVSLPEEVRLSFVLPNA